MSTERYASLAVRSRRVTPGIGLAVLAFIPLAAGSCTLGEAKAGLGPNDNLPEAISIIPEATAVMVGEAVLLRAQVSGTSGPVAAAQVGWSASGGTLTPVSSSEAQFSSPSPGVYMIRAYSQTSPSVVDSTYITIVAPDSPILSIAISPSVETISTGGSVQFTVTATRADGTLLTPAVTYSATGGTITSGGLYTAGSTAGTFRVIATQQGGILADTSTVILSTASGTASCIAGVAGSYPHEPAGFSRVLEHEFGAIPSGSNGVQGSWGNNGGPNLTIVHDSAAPVGDGDCLRTRYPQGQPSGSAPVTVWGDATGDSGRRDEQYFSLWFLIEGTTYENQSVGTKFGFLGYGQSASGALNQGFLFLKGGGGMQSTIPLEFWQQNTTSRNLTRNVGAGNAVTVGKWHHVEIVMAINTVGAANGVFQMWVDGVQTHQYTDVTYRTASAPLGFRGWKWDPTWGGMGGTKTREDFIRLAHVYLSGK